MLRMVVVTVLSVEPMLRLASQFPDMPSPQAVSSTDYTTSGNHPTHFSEWKTPSFISIRGKASLGLLGRGLCAPWILKTEPHRYRGFRPMSEHFAKSIKVQDSTSIYKTCLWLTHRNWCHLQRTLVSCKSHFQINYISRRKHLRPPIQQTGMILLVINQRMWMGFSRCFHSVGTRLIWLQHICHGSLSP